MPPRSRISVTARAALKLSGIIDYIYIYKCAQGGSIARNLVSSSRSIIRNAVTDADRAITTHRDFAGALQSRPSINNNGLLCDQAHLGYFFFFQSGISERATRVARTRRAARMSQRGGLRGHISLRACEGSPTKSLSLPLPPLAPVIYTPGAPRARYYRGIIQTYLYPSPMTADMTCDRLRYRLHDIFRSLSLSLSSYTPLPSQFSTVLPRRPPSCALTSSLARPSLSRARARHRAAIAPMEKYARPMHDVHNSRESSCVLLPRAMPPLRASNKTNNVR